MVVPSTLLARLATSVVRLAIFLATVHKRLLMVTFLVMSLILVSPLSWHQLLPSHRFPWDRHRSIGLDELLINHVESVIAISYL